MNPLKHSIKYLTERLQNPTLYKTKPSCLYLTHVSQLIKNTTESFGGGYIDSYYLCQKTKKRTKKRGCVNCKMYSPLITNFKNEN